MYNGLLCRLVAVRQVLQAVVAGVLVLGRSIEALRVSQMVESIESHR